ncbi:MAG TPA: threonine/serine exporter family protein, partial [Chroococcidiopsis sp.]
NRLSLIEALTTTIPPNTSPQAIAARLDAIEQTPPLYPRAWVIGWVAIACGAFAVLAGGRWVEFLAATAGAAFSLTVRDRLAAGRLNPIAITVFCAAIASLLCQLIITGLGQVGLGTDTPEFGLLSSVLFLVPGVALVTAALDLVRFDLVSGMSRLAYAILLLTSIAVGMLITLAITGTQVI